MFDKEAIEQIQLAQAITAADEAARAYRDALALPQSFQLHDMESYQRMRRRARGLMETRTVGSFAAYVKAHKEAGASVFISQDHMLAYAYLNLGTPQSPGHADNKAKLSPERTAPYMALRAIANGSGQKQAAVAEFLEDWTDLIRCFNDEGQVTNPKAIAAIRKLSIESMRKTESSEQQLSASRSAFESVQATSVDPLPTTIYFQCNPYAEMLSRQFVLRLGVLTGNDRPAITLRIVKLEQHAEEMANELAHLIETAFGDDGVNVMLGS